MDNELYDATKTLVEDGRSQDEVLLFLYSKKLFITDAIVAIRRLYGIRLDEAKRVVAASRYWQREHENNKGLHDALEEMSRNE